MHNEVIFVLLITLQTKGKTVGTKRDYFQWHESRVFYFSCAHSNGLKPNPICGQSGAQAKPTSAFFIFVRHKYIFLYETILEYGISCFLYHLIYTLFFVYRFCLNMFESARTHFFKLCSCGQHRLVCKVSTSCWMWGVQNIIFTGSLQRAGRGLFC